MRGITNGTSDQNYSPKKKEKNIGEAEVAYIRMIGDHRQGPTEKGEFSGGGYRGRGGVNSRGLLRPKKKT